MYLGKILVLDDLPDWRETLSGLLLDYGYEVCIASSIKEALDLIDEEQINIAILDVRLDETDEDNRDGLDLMHTIKKRYPFLEIILLTGYADVKMIQEALNPDPYGNSTAFCFIEKDNMDELPGLVNQAYQKSLSNVKNIISQGENEYIEFKSRMRWEHEKEGFRPSRIIIAKTIAGMMNFRGGTLLIGVDDDGNVLGIEEDLYTLRKKNTDGFRLDLTTIIKDFLNIQFVEFIHPRFELIDGKQVCVVSISPSPRPVFLNSGNKKEFWVRAGNSTRQLDVEEATEYIQNHWG